MKINIKNHMTNSAYSFPKSLVSYKINDIPKGTVLTDGENIIPYQVSSDEGKISFITDLKAGEHKVYETTNNSTAFRSIAAESEGVITASNGVITLKSDSRIGTLFTIESGGIYAEAVIDADVKSKKTEITENGAVYAKIKISVCFSDGAAYTVTVTLFSQSEYAVLDEDIKSDAKRDMKLLWHNFNPIGRIIQNTACSAYGADEYTDENGKIFQRMLPHDQSNGYENTKFCAFSDGKISSGVFMGDVEKWNDGSYAIEGMNHINALNAYCKYSGDKCSLYFRYPLNRGTRQTAIAFYDSEKDNNKEFKSHIEELYFYAVMLPLNRYKDWIFEWDCDKAKFPVYFDLSKIDKNQKYNFGDWKKGVPDTAYMLSYIKQNEVYAKPWLIGPVRTRCYGEWVSAFDINASEMTDEEFDEYRKILIFGAYYCSMENFMPIKNTLAGHPNFLIDTQMITGACAALFPEHPMAAKWKERYERCVALTFRFHIRPEVEKWKSRGGRPTESQGTYAFGCLNHMMQASFMIEKVYGDNPMLYKGCELLADWLLNISAVEIDGRRVMPYTGAHAGCHMLNPYYHLYHTRMLGRLMMEYNPQLGEQLLSLCPSEPVIGHETAFYNGRDIWDFVVYKKYYNNKGISPQLKSSKYTGYGFNLRSHVGEHDEMFVLLQQIDDGQNYRWGRAAEGGCGVLHYMADGKSFSGVRKEDIGDDNFSDDMVGCNFSVLFDHTYKCVGRNDLTQPLVDFGFVKYAKVNAGSYSDYEYKYRSVMMIDNRYIAIYDAVRDIRTAGKFNWFCYTDEQLPHIYQLKPGAKPIAKDAPEYTVDDEPRYKAYCRDRDVRGVSYNGSGDFFTVVTHKDDVTAKKAEFGAVVCENEYVFDSAHTVKYISDECEFFGKTGFFRKKSGGFESCIIDGVKFAAFGVSLEITSGKGSVSLVKDGRGYHGKVIGDLNLKISVSDDNCGLFYHGNSSDADRAEDGIIVKHLMDESFEITEADRMPEKISLPEVYETTGGAEVYFEPIDFADGYEAELTCGSMKKIYKTEENSFVVPKQSEKSYIRVRALNGNEVGPWSDTAAVYFTGSAPNRVKGFRISAKKDGVGFIWGRQYGAQGYKLYRINADGSKTCLYEGKDNEYFTNDKAVYSYAVTAVNGFGESEISEIRDTDKSSLAYYDPFPDKGCIRDTVVNLHGYLGFDYLYNENRKILEYPD